MIVFYKTIFVRDLENNLVADHVIRSSSEDIVNSVTDAFEFAMTQYAKDYKVYVTPLNMTYMEDN